MKKERKHLYVRTRPQHVQYTPQYIQYSTAHSTQITQHSTQYSTQYTYVGFTTGDTVSYGGYGPLVHLLPGVREGGEGVDGLHLVR